MGPCVLLTDSGSGPVAAANAVVVSAPGALQASDSSVFDRFNEGECFRPTCEAETSF